MDNDNEKGNDNIFSMEEEDMKKDIVPEFQLDQDNGQTNTNMENQGQYTINMVKNEQYNMPKSYVRQKNLIYTDEFKDKLTLSPLKKYAKYGKFPFKLLIHISLIIFTSVQIQYMHSQFSPFSLDQEQQWLTVFYGDSNSNDSNGIYEFYDLPDLQKQFDQLFKNINSYNDQYYQQLDLSKTDIYLQYAPLFFNKEDVFTNFNKDPIDRSVGIQKPFNQNDGQSIKAFLAKTHYFSIRLDNVAVQIARHSQSFTCWDFALQYSFIANTVVQSSLLTNGRVCDTYEPLDLLKSTNNPPQLFQGSQYFINIVILLLALSSCFLSFKYIVDMVRDYTTFKQKGQILIPVVKPPLGDNQKDTLIQIISEQRSWEELSFKEKRKYFDNWFIIIMVGNLCQVSASLLILTLGHHDYLISGLNESLNWLQGFGCALAWLTALKYFDYFSKFNITSQLIKNSFPKIGKQFLGFFPILSSYVIVGMTSFGASERFATLRDSFATLFSLLLGDSIRDITLDLSHNGISQDIAVLYITSFIVIFILALNNVMVAIINDECEQRKIKLDQEMEEKKQLKFKKKLQIAKNIEEKRIYSSMTKKEKDIIRGTDQPQSMNVFSEISSHSNDILTKSAPDQEKEQKSVLQIAQLTLQKNSSRKIQEKDRNLDFLHPVQEDNQEIHATETSDLEGGQKTDSPLHNNEVKMNEESNLLIKSPKKQWQGLSQILKKQQSENILNSIEEQDISPKLSPRFSSKQKSKGVVPSPRSDKTESQIIEDQKSTISLKALARVVSQLNRSKKHAQENINLKEQFKKEVELITEQKLQFRELYKLFKKGFNTATSILDKQSYEIKDNLYLYRLSKSQHNYIIKKFCDYITYFLIRTKV